MSIVQGHINGEKTTVAAKRNRWTDPELRRLRQGMMYERQIRGMPIAAIAKLFSISRGYAYQELDDLPDSVKRKLDEAYQNGKVCLAF